MIELRKKVEKPDDEWQTIHGFEVAANLETGSITLDFGIADIAISPETAMTMAEALVQAAMAVGNTRKEPDNG